MITSLKTLQQPISTLPAITPLICKKLLQAKINNILDLLFYLPFNVIKRTYCPTIKHLVAKEHAIIELTVIKYTKGYKKTTVLCQDNEGNYINIVYFYAPKYLSTYLPLNNKVIITDYPDYYLDQLVFSHPTIVNIKKKDTIKLIEPIYTKIDGLSSAKIYSYILSALNMLNKAEEVVEWLDEDYVKNNNLPCFKTALNNIHKPQSILDILPTSHNVIRLAIDEVVAYHYFAMLNKQEIPLKGISMACNNLLVKPVLKNLPFQLTTDQINAVKVLKNYLLDNTKQDNILLQGDVGSGKTIVCFIAALFAIESGYQVAVLAPTDILANQHYNNFINYAKGIDINISLLTGKTTAKNKKIIYTKLQQQQINCIVGTHAVFQQKVEFAKLGLAIIDEQHRFGVNQRLQLSSKAEHTKVILTTATPIPRTLALSYYEDIELVEIQQKPSNRKEIITKTISKDKLLELITFLTKQLNNNEKVFWVCPLIEESEHMQLSSVANTFDILKNHFKEHQLLLVHGKLKLNEKEDVLLKFKNLSTGAILIATTVIEVGIDIPTCNIIIIDNAQNFGLSQLHQLRGRVGRSNKQGYCILLYDNNLNETAKARLKIIKSTTNGFTIAEEDLNLRGYGNLFGIEQSGFNLFSIFNINYHANHLVYSINYAKKLLQLQKNNNYKAITMVNYLHTMLFKYNNNYIKIG